MRDLSSHLQKIREAHPRASILYAQILLLLGNRRMAQQDVIAEFSDNRNDSTIPAILTNLERLGIIEIDRGPRGMGNTIAVVRGAGK